MLFENYLKEHPIHSPVRTQYLQIKRQHPDALLFFRMGDFYEMFDEDAEIVARELEIALTRRDFGRGEKSPMVGVFYHAVDGYIARLVSKGYRVAVCEQTSDPALSKGLVDREVLRIVTPGTVIDPTMLAAYGARHSRIFFIIGRLPDDMAVVRVQAAQRWLDSQYHFIAQIVTRTVTIRLYSTGTTTIA